jgi:hypothetical protein
MRNFARDIYDENKRRNERLISLEALTMAELSQLSIFDDYDSNYIIMASYNYDIRIEDVLIAQAVLLQSLKIKRALSELQIS